MDVKIFSWLFLAHCLLNGVNAVNFMVSLTRAPEAQGGVKAVQAIHTTLLTTALGPLDDVTSAALYEGVALSETTTPSSCTFTFIGYSALTAEDFSITQVPFTTCLESPRVTTGASTDCASPLPGLTWVDDDGSTSSPVIVLQCPETPTTMPMAPSITPQSPVTMACESPVTHTSSATLSGGSMTEFLVTVCEGGISLIEDQVSTPSPSETESSETSEVAVLGSGTSDLDYPTAFTPTMTGSIETETTLVLDTKPPPVLTMSGSPAATSVNETGTEGILGTTVSATKPSTTLEKTAIATETKDSGASSSKPTHQHLLAWAFLLACPGALLFLA